MVMSSTVRISIVTYNSGQHLKRCLESLEKQTFSNFEVHIFDNASNDNTVSIITGFRPFLKSVHFSKTNLGFCAAHNRILGSTSSDYVLVLNPDVILDARFLEILVAEMDRNPDAGTATGKLYRWHGATSDTDALPALSKQLELDSTGIYFTRSQRHFDRGSGEIDAGRYNRNEYVFGASGAAALCRSSMLDDIRDGMEYFDESFFAYREDADLAWRAQWMGWRCLYIPEARGFHERKVLPSRRSSLPDAINMHSFKNRFLLRIKNMDAGTYMRNFIPITSRDIAAIVYVLLVERSSLAGIALLLRAIPKARAARQALKKRRRLTPREIRPWFTGQKSKSLQA